MSNLTYRRVALGVAAACCALTAALCASKSPPAADVPALPHTQQALSSLGQPSNGRDAKLAQLRPPARSSALHDGRDSKGAFQQLSPAQHLLDSYVERSKYPPTSRPLREQQTDLIFPNRRYERPTPVGDGDPTSFLFTADKYFVHGEEGVTLLLQVTREQAPSPVTILEASLAAAGTTQAVPLSFAADGGMQTSRIVPAELFQVSRASILVATVTFDYGGAEPASGRLRIHFTPVSGIPATFTGRTKHAIDEGSLVVEVEMEVAAAGYYLLDCNLWTLDDQPVVWTRFKGSLNSGRQWVPLRFFGKAILDVGLQPPFRLGQLRGFRFVENAVPDTEAVLPLTEEPVLDDLSLEGLSDEAWNSPHKQATIEAMKRGIAAGTLLAPPVAE